MAFLQILIRMLIGFGTCATSDFITDLCSTRMEHRSDDGLPTNSVRRERRFDEFQIFCLDLLVDSCSTSSIDSLILSPTSFFSMFASTFSNRVGCRGGEMILLVFIMLCAHIDSRPLCVTLC